MQLKLSPQELRRLASRVDEDYHADLADHRRRMDRFRRYYRMWRSLVDPPEAGEEDTSNFQVPVLKWHVFTKWAKEVGEILGDDAAVIAKPTGPSDQRIVHKVGRFMTWRMLQSMRITRPLAVFDFRKILFGRAHAYCPYVRDVYEVLGEDGERRSEVYYEGPGFFPEWPDDVIVPAEDVATIHDFSHVIRRYRATPDDLLRGDGTLYQGVAGRFGELVELAKQFRERDAYGEEVKGEKDQAEGVTYEGSTDAHGSLQILEYYGGWRMLLGRKDGREDNLDRRERLSEELVIRYQPDLDIVLGVQRLIDIYPKMRYRRPFAEAALTYDGSYWPPGVGELIEDIQDEASVNHNLFTDAGEFSVGPLIFARPEAGVDPDKLRYRPRQVIWTEDPAGVNVVRMQADLQYPIVKEQAVLGYGERVLGQSDLAMGRDIQRPTASKTASGTLALLETGNIRVSLDTHMFREDMGIIAGRIWELDSEFSPESVFFRVTEEEANGLFDVARGGAFMTGKERGGRYDFDLKFATPAWSKEAQRERQLQLYGLDLQNPLIATNPRALWMITNQVHKAMGDDNFADIVPAPPEMDGPKAPREEWTAALQGEEIHVHPADNDDLHLIDHYRRLNAAKKDRDADEGAVNMMIGHVLEHQQQKRTKMLMQAMTQQLARELGGNTAESGGLRAPMGSSLDELGGLIGELGGGGGESLNRRGAEAPRKPGGEY